MKKFLVFFAALFTAASVFAQQMPPIPVDEAVRIGKLENGLTYYIRHNEEPAGQANFYIAQKVGSILEEENQRGLAHFLEHMCFNGTEKFPGNGVIKYCENIGVRFGGDLNAYTSIDETVYNIDNVPVANIPSAVDSCLWILHDWADGLLLTDEDIDHERGVIHEEWRTRTNAAMRQYEKILVDIYPNNKYSSRMPIGTMEVIDNFPYQALRDYYEKWYRPDQQGVVVVGDIDVDAVEAKIREIFGTIATPVNPAERYYVPVEDNDAPIISIAKDKEQPYAMSFIFCKHDKVPAEGKLAMNYLAFKYAIQMAESMLGARIQEMLQSPEPPFIQAEVGDDDFFIASTKGALTGQVVSSENDVVKAVTSLYREMLRAARGGFTDTEYERARSQYITNLESAYNQRSKRKSASFCQQYVRHFIDNEPIPGIENQFAIMNQLAPNIPVEVVNQVFASLIMENNLVAAFMLPDKEGVTYPSESEMAKILTDVAAENIEPYVDQVSNEPLISSLPVPGKVKKVKDSLFGYKQYVLSNGATVYIKTTDYNPDEILMNAFSYGGTSLYPESNELKVAREVMSLGGVGNFSKTELKKALAGKKVSITPSISLYSEALGGKTTPKDLETLLQLNYLYFTSLRSDEDAFVSWKTREYASLKNQELEPNSALQDSLMSTIYKDGSRMTYLKADDIEGLDYEKIMTIARERFANAADFTFVFTGNIDEAVAIPLIEQYIGSLPSSKKKEKYNAQAGAFATGERENIFDRSMEVPMVTSFFFESAPVKYNLKNDLSFDLAMRALSVILLEEIREKEGGTYGISANGQTVGAPKYQSYFQIAYQTDPARYEYLNKRVREIVADFAANGTTEETFAKGKEYLAKKYKENLRENGFWTSAIIEYLQNKIDVVTDYETILQGITVEDSRTAVDNVLKAGNHQSVIMHGVPAE